MKELSIEEKAKAYDKAVNKFAYLLESTDLIKGDLKHDIEIIFPELKESEDERIRKEILDCFKAMKQQGCFPSKHKEQYDSWIAWLEKQGEHANFRNKIQVGDKVTRNEDGVLVNLSQLKRIAKPAEEYNITGIRSKNAQGKLGKMIKKLKPVNEVLEQNSADKVEPKFKTGDWIITNKNHIWYVDETPETTSYLYRLINQYGKVEVAEFEVVDKKARLWTIQDAKDGDVLADDYGIYIFEKFDECDRNCYVCIGAYQYSQKVYECEHMLCSTDAHPATKEQCDTLMKAMADAGYTFDFERKELKKIEQKPTWSEEDEKILSDIIKDLVHPWNEYIPDRIEDEIKWLKNKLKTLKDRVQPQQKQEWSEDIINRGIKEVGLTQYQIDWLKRNVFYPPKPEWSEEDETARNNIIDKLAILKSRAVDGGAEKEICEMEINWLKSLHPQNKQEWTQDDIDMIDWLIRCCEKEHEELCNDRYGHQDIVSDLKRDCRKKWDWLESLKERVAPQSHWKPSEGQLECLGNAIDKAEKDYPTSD